VFQNLIGCHSPKETVSQLYFSIVVSFCSSKACFAYCHYHLFVEQARQLQFLKKNYFYCVLDFVKESVCTPCRFQGNLNAGASCGFKNRRNYASYRFIRFWFYGRDSF
jgi:hypothetical protein